MTKSPFAKLKASKTPKTLLPAPPQAPLQSNLQRPEANAVVDGRTLCRTNMTEPLYLRLQPGTRDRIKLAAVRDRKTMGQLMTEAFALYEADNA